MVGGNVSHQEAVDWALGLIWGYLEGQLTWEDIQQAKASAPEALEHIAHCWDEEQCLSTRHIFNKFAYEPPLCSPDELRRELKQLNKRQLAKVSLLTFLERNGGLENRRVPATVGA